MSEELEIVLPSKKIKVKNRNPRTFVMYSQPKMGKTTLISELDECLLIDLENGSEFVDAVKYKVNTIKELYALGEKIKEKRKPYKYIAIDTISQLEHWAESAATAKYKSSNMGKNFAGKSVLELPNGAGYLHLRLAFQAMLEYTKTLAEHVIFVAHLKDKMINKGGKEVSAKDLALTGQIRNMVSANADAIGYLYREEEKLMINFQAKEELICGSRCEHLKGQNFEFDWKKIYVD